MSRVQFKYLPVEAEIGLAVVALFRSAVSKEVPGRFEAEPGRATPDKGLPDWVMGRIAGLGPSRLAPTRAVGTRREVPGLAAVAIVSSVNNDSAIPSSKISKKSTRTCSVKARVLRLQTA
jgi:hypothetical protein